MDPDDKDNLQRHYAKLLDVVYSSISPHLISNFVLTLDMHDEIDSRPTERKKMEKLISILPSRGGHAMKELITALKPSYRWLARELENGGNDNRAYANVHINNNNQDDLPETGIGSYLRELVRIMQRHTRVSTHWTFLANSMSLSPATVMDIKREMSLSGGHEYAILSILEAWVTKAGNSRATFSKLISILSREGMNSCAEEVVQYWRSLQLRRHSEAECSREEPQSLRRPSANHPRSPVITDV